jgi:uncharacterized protein YjbI with pentapeptide repeats
MANPDHLSKLREGVRPWNSWRDTEYVEPDLSKANLSDANLRNANLRDANLRDANLYGANLSKANLNRADLRCADLRNANLRNANLNSANLIEASLGKTKLRGATFIEAKLSGANLSLADLLGALLFRAILFGANLSLADLRRANLSGAIVCGADFSEADVSTADLTFANFSGAKLCFANLKNANLSGANLTGANLYEANLMGAILVNTKLREANLTGANLSESVVVRTDLKTANLTNCRVYGLSVWDAQLEGTTQANLVITPKDVPAITVDNLEVAQFIYLLLNNAKLREVIDSITSKVVLILGRFTPERKAILDAIRDELRKRDYLPVLFDFEKPASRDITETVSTLAHMARFVIADITDAKSIPQELMRIVPGLPSVPVQPLLLASQREYGMFEHFRRFPWVLEPFLYENQDQLLAALTEKVIGPAEAKAKAQTAGR